MIEFVKPTREKEDYQRFYVAETDPNFNYERNEQIIQETIEEAEKKRRKKRKESREKLRERTDAVADYLRHLEKGNTTPIERYFGKRRLAYLRGQKIIQMLRPDGSIVLQEVN